MTGAVGVLLLVERSTRKSKISLAKEGYGVVYADHDMDLESAEH